MQSGQTGGSSWGGPNAQREIKERRLWGVSVPRSRLAPCCTQPMEGAACIVVIAANWGQTVAAPKSPQTMVN
jgi:hypothetical protein